jgi:hypothetical protein
MSAEWFEKFKDPRWQKKRLEIMERDGWKCVKCGDASNELQVNHRFYIKGKDQWDYDNRCLETLCRPCHEIVTDKQRELRNALSLLPSSGLDRAIGFVAGLACRGAGDLTAVTISETLDGAIEFIRGIGLNPRHSPNLGQLKRIAEQEGRDLEKALQRSEGGRLKSSRDRK